jgi:hypothetical protein
VEATVELSIASPFIPYRCIRAQIWDSAAPREYGARHASDEVTDALVALIMTLAALPASAARPATGPYCATQLSQPPGGGPTTIVGTECFGNYADTTAFAAGERLVLPADFAPADMSNEVLGFSDSDGSSAVTNAGLLSRFLLSKGEDGRNSPVRGRSADAAP